MRLGILTDIHEAVEQLRGAFLALDAVGVDRVIVLGNVYDDGSRLEEAVSLLDDRRPLAVWGNHDVLLTGGPDPDALNANRPLDHTDSTPRLGDGGVGVSSISDCRERSLPSDNWRVSTGTAVGHASFPGEQPPLPEATAERSLFQARPGGHRWNTTSAKALGPYTSKARPEG